MYNNLMNEKELNVKVGDTVMVQGNKGRVLEVIRDYKVEWNGTEYVKIPDSDYTNVVVHFEGELANWGQYQDGQYGQFTVVEPEVEEITLTGYEMTDEPQNEDIREIISGHFAEGEKVTVNIDGHIITRKVFWCGAYQDLAVRYNNQFYGYSEFWNR